MTEEMSFDVAESTAETETKLTSREDQIAKFQEELRVAMQIKDPEARANELNIINAKFEDVVKQDQDDQANFAARVRDLDESLGLIDLEIGSYENYSDQEQGWIDAATRESEEAKAGLTKAQSAMFFKGRAIAKAEEAIKEAENALERAKQRADEAKGVRLANASIEDSTTNYIRAGRIVRDQADVRRQHALKQTTILSEQLDIIERELTEETANADTLRAEVSRLEAEVESAKASLAEENAGSESYQAADNRVRELEQQLNTATDNSDKALAETKQLKKFLAGTQTSLRTQEKMARNLDIIIQIIDTGLNKRIPLIESRLETMKSMETLRVARQVADVGDDIDEGNAEYAAKAANAVDEFVTEYLEKDPERIQKQREILAEQTKNSLAQRKRIKELWDKYDTDFEAEAA